MFSRSAPAYFRCKLPVIKMKGDGTASKIAVLDNFPIFLPHEIFSWYFHNDRQRFDKLFLSETTPLERKQFWQELKARRDPRLDNHPMTAGENWEENTVGISIHGDGIPVLGVGKVETRSLNDFSIQSLFSSGPTVEVKILLYWLFADTESEDTRLEIWRMLCWSFY